MEHLDLGIVGLFAGKPGKNYPARRYSQFIIKKFRIPMARRTDVSRTQLGYKLVVSVGGGQDGTVEMVLCGCAFILEVIPVVGYPGTSPVSPRLAQKA